jgi:hypothetical protein
VIDLQRYGLAEEWRALATLQAECSFLEQRCAGAERDVRVAREAIEQACQQDSEVAAKAIRAGKDMPSAKEEEKAQKRLASAERSLAAFTRAVSDARSDLGQYQAKHAADLRNAIISALRIKAEQLAKHASEAHQLFGLLEDSRYVLKDLASPPTEDYDGPAARLSTYVMGVQVTQSAGTTDPPRGDVEATLAYLTSLQERFVLEGEQGGSDAA